MEKFLGPISAPLIGVVVKEIVQLIKTYAKLDGWRVLVIALLTSAVFAAPWHLFLGLRELGDTFDWIDLALLGYETFFYTVIVALISIGVYKLNQFITEERNAK